MHTLELSKFVQWSVAYSYTKWLFGGQLHAVALTPLHHTSCMITKFNMIESARLFRYMYVYSGWKSTSITGQTVAMHGQNVYSYSMLRHGICSMWI